MFQNDPNKSDNGHDQSSKGQSSNVVTQSSEKTTFCKINIDFIIIENSLSPLFLFRPSYPPPQAPCMGNYLLIE